MSQPLILSAVGAAPFPLCFQEYSKDREVEAELEGAEKAEVSELLPEEVEISELLSEEELGEVVEWRESVAVLEIIGIAPE